MAKRVLTSAASFSRMSRHVKLHSDLYLSTRFTDLQLYQWTCHRYLLPTDVSLALLRHASKFMTMNEPDLLWQDYRLSPYTTSLALTAYDSLMSIGVDTVSDSKHHKTVSDIFHVASLNDVLKPRHKSAAQSVAWAVAAIRGHDVALKMASHEYGLQPSPRDNAAVYVLTYKSAGSSQRRIRYATRFVLQRYLRTHRPRL